MNNRSVDVHPIVAQIIDRDCHVSMSNRAVIRHVVSRLKDGYHTFRQMSKPDRRALMRQCVWQHSQNWQLYVDVMRGRPRSRYDTVTLTAKVSESLSGVDVCQLMRKHKKTISQLSFLLGVSAKRVREVRASGLQDPLAVRDWYQMITGDDPGPIPSSCRIKHHTEEASCGFCGCPLYVGDTAFEYAGEVFCSKTCCRNSRGWS